jgi:hypothetical protein
VPDTLATLAPPRQVFFRENQSVSFHLVSPAIDPAAPLLR